MNDVRQRIDFLREAEKLKGILRRNRPIGATRRENAAEHSWHTTLAALLFAADAPITVDVTKVMKMMLIHDIVEIDAGDILVFDDAAREANAAAEHAAAERLFGLLPAAEGSALHALWLEFEANQSAEAQFAKAADRIIPVLQNLAQDGGSWIEHGITREQVIEKVRCIETVSPLLWRTLQRELDEATFWD